MVERESMLRTKAMREKEEQRQRRRYRFCLVRVRFPDGLILQVGEFLHIALPLYFLLLVGTFAAVFKTVSLVGGLCSTEEAFLLPTQQP